MFNNLTKLTKILYLDQTKFNTPGFISFGARAVLRLLVTVKNFWQYKNYFEIYLWGKKHFVK